MTFLDQLRRLDTNNIGAWPGWVMGFFSGSSFLLIGLLGWYLLVGEQQQRLAGKIGEEVLLKREFAAKRVRVAGSDAMQRQLDGMQDTLHQLLRQLPGKTEMPELLVDISQTAAAAGIDTELFQPGIETARDVYAERPISLRMVGTYHQFGAFISGVASLPRVVILTLHDVSLGPRPGHGQNGADGGQLILQGTVKTYRYLDDASPPPARSAPAARSRP